eukprot:TRINITY_DN1661_c0_g1_i1.p1 TRINITY_DN1661_c0_g1~~TRINITY_DN1661_c0_g1_i1.p1  ORF type:complete len:132 (-),score=29.27 TRINITY_DN1661_c0_g1_i1:71-466(-)
MASTCRTVCCCLCDTLCYADKNVHTDTLEFSTSQPLTVFPNSGIYPLSTPVAQAYDAQAEVNMIFFGVTGSGIYAVCPERQTVQNVLTTPNNLCQPITIAVISAANGQVEALASVQTPDHDLHRHLLSVLY